MDELVNISNYCSMLLIKYGQALSECRTIYIADEDALEFRIKYNGNSTWQYSIPNFNFFISNTEVLVNNEVIDTINAEMDRRLNIVTNKFNI